MISELRLHNFDIIRLLFFYKRLLKFAKSGNFRKFNHRQINWSSKTKIRIKIIMRRNVNEFNTDEDQNWSEKITFFKKFIILLNSSFTRMKKKKLIKKEISQILNNFIYIIFHEFQNLNKFQTIQKFLFLINHYCCQIIRIIFSIPTISSFSGNNLSPHISFYYIHDGFLELVNAFSIVSA